MYIKETFKDIGRKMIGQGEEVRFKNEVAEYAASHGVPLEQATKTILFDRFRNVGSELGTNGIIDARSKDFKQFKAALREICGRETLRRFSKDGNDPTIFRSLLVSPSNPREINHVRSYFSKNFKGKTPAFGVIRDSSDNMKLIGALLRRFSGDPRLGGPDSFRDILTAHPELGADLGKLFDAKGATERHERMFDKDLKFEKTMGGFKKTAQESLTEMLWKAPGDYMTQIVKRGLDMSKGGLGGVLGVFMKETGRFMGREAWAGTKLLVKSAHTVGSLIKNKTFR